MPLSTSYNPYAPGTLQTPVTAPRVSPGYTYTPPVTGRSGWQQTGDFLGSQAGQTALGAGVAGLSAYLQAREANKNRELSTQENALDREQRERNRMAQAAQAIMQNRTRMAEGALRPLGEGAAFATRQARTGAIADLLGQRLTPGNPRIAAAMGPGNRVSPEVLARLRQASSPEVTAAAIAQRDMDVANINPAAAGTDIAGLTGLQPESPFLADLFRQRQASAERAQAGVDESESYARQLLRQAIDMQSLGQPGGAAPGAGFRGAQRRTR
jgi:hypothetical protein